MKRITATTTALSTLLLLSSFAVTGQSTQTNALGAVQSTSANPLIQLAHHGQSRYHNKNIRKNAKRGHWRPKTEFYGEDSIATGNFSEMASRSSGKKRFVFDPRRLKWYAYNHNGSLVASGRASGGKHYCPDVRRACRTPVGSFSVHRKGSAYCKSSKYPLGRGGAPMPYCMFFRGGYAIHGSPDVPSRNASHGCIRVLPSAARWLHRNFIDHGTNVIVKPY